MSYTIIVLAHDLQNKGIVRYCRLIAAWGLVGLHAACVIDTVPLPEGRNKGATNATPDVAAGAGINTNALYYTDQSPILLVGAEGAVRSYSDIWVTNLNGANGWQTATNAAANGSFNVPLAAQVGDQIEIIMELDYIELDDVVITLEPPSADASQANADLANRSYDGSPSAGGGFGECSNGICGTPGVTLVVTAPDALGLVTVSGPPGSIADNITVVVANLTRGTSTTATRFPDGSFSARLPGSTGDQLAIFAVDPASSNGGSTPTVGFVP